MMDGAEFLCRPIVFQIPERVVSPPSWLEHTPFAFWIVDALRPALFVELGCHSGNSYSSFAQAVQTLGLSTACYAIDTWRGDPHAGTFDDRVFEEWTQYHDRRFSGFSRLIQSTFDDALEHFADKSVDLLHIDGYHTFEAVAHDFEAWRGKVSDRGVVLCHDINVRERDFGVWRLWDRLKGEYPSFEFRHGHGLGVLGLGSDLPAAVEWLLSISSPDAEIVRAFFARLGAAVRAGFDAEHAQETMQSELTRQDEVLRATRAGLEDENRELRDALKIADQALAAREADVAQLTERLERREAERVQPTVVVVSHVGAWRPRAGNEYRLHRMLQWQRRNGYRIIPVIAPLPGEELSRDALEGTATLFGNAIQVHRDGRIEQVLHDVPDSLLPFAPALDPRPLALPERNDASTAQQRELLKIDRTFCHDAVISTVLALQQALGPHVLQVEYIWMTRLFPLVRGDVLKVVDTHDVFSSIEQKVRMFGLRDVAINPEEEAERLRRADLVVAIQDEERRELQRLVPSIPTLSAGVDFDVVGEPEGSVPGRVLYVASNNQRNCKGLSDFLRLAWPRIRRVVADATLVIVGGVAKVVADKEVAGVTVAGALDDLTAVYREAALVINPVVAGTGAKIKTLEALSQLRPMVTWPAGIDGLDNRMTTHCIVARDWFEFANFVIQVLSNGDEYRFTRADRDVIAECLGPAAVYAAVDAAYSTYFSQVRVNGGPIAAIRSSVSDGAAVHAD